MRAQRLPVLWALAFYWFNLSVRCPKAVLEHAARYTYPATYF